MTTYTLTAGNDAPGQTSGADIYDGFNNGGQTGGTDTLNGGAGNDRFQIGDGSAGTITGGADTDTVQLYGTSLGTTTFTTVEVLDLAEAQVFASIAQLKSFSSIIDSNNINAQLSFYLSGAGGTINFSTLINGTIGLNIYGRKANGALNITGSGGNDLVQGSGYADYIDSGGGMTIYLTVAYLSILIR